jgi:hypothetical protein
MIMAVIGCVVSVIFLPQIFLSPSGNDLRSTSLVEFWNQQNLALPILTQWAIQFAKAKTARLIVTFVLIGFAIFAEARISNRKLAGTIHAFLLLIAWILGILVVFAAILPTMPL